MTEQEKIIKEALEKLLRLDEIDRTSYQAGINHEKNITLVARELTTKLFPMPKEIVITSNFGKPKPAPEPIIVQSVPGITAYQGVGRPTSGREKELVYGKNSMVGEWTLSKPTSELTSVEYHLRTLLWASHGCVGKYGDDGELQCGHMPPIDFRRDTPGEIERKSAIHNLQRVPPAPESFRERLAIHLANQHGNFLGEITEIEQIEPEYRQSWLDKADLIIAIFLKDGWVKP